MYKEYAKNDNSLKKKIALKILNLWIGEPKRTFKFLEQKITKKPRKYNCIKVSPLKTF